MDLDLKDKIIIVTGGAKGIGGAICTALKQEKAIPVIIDRDEKSALALSKQLKLRKKPVIADLSSVSDCKEAVDQIVSEYGRIDGLVNNAGVNDGVGLEKGSPETFINSLHINLVQVYAITHYALPELKKTQGPIVNISSKTAVTGQGNTSGYVAAKGGILGLTREWAVELLPFSIRVNTVVPAEVYTPLYEQYLRQFIDPEKSKSEIEQRIPLERRMTTPQEIADTVAFLLSRRSSHTTGQILFVDGGYTHLDRAI